jgi:hypothetical protein
MKIILGRTYCCPKIPSQAACCGIYMGSFPWATKTHESLPKGEIPILSLTLIKNLGVRIIRVFKLKRRKKDFQLMNHMYANPPLTKLTSVDSL